MATTAERPRFELTERIRALAAAAAQRARSAPGDNRVEAQTAAFRGRYAHLPLPERQARSLAEAMMAEPVLLHPGERLHGMFYRGADPQWHCPDWGDDCVTVAASRRVAAEVPEMAPLVGQWPQGRRVDGAESFIIDGSGIPGHVAWHWERVLSGGMEGLIAQHQAALAATEDAAARSYYQGALIMLEAAIEWNRRHVAALRERLATETNAEERSRLATSLCAMEQVPAGPARSFYEAVQSFYFQWQCVMYEAPYGGNSPGRLDWYLWPFLRDEYEAGLISYQEAGELLAELFLKIDERVHCHDGHVNTIVVGGVAPDGSDALNPLSWLLLDVFEQLDLTHPAVYTRISSANPPAWHDRCVAYLLRGGNRAQILADEPIIAAMTRDDRLPYADAAQYMCGGCMELAPHGLNSDLLFSFIYNLPKTLELVLTGGECLTTGRQRLDVAGSLASYDDFEALYAAFEHELNRALLAKFRCLDIWSEEMARCRPLFLLSSMTDDCLARGRSQQDGGARYADYGGTPLGIQNAADALYAVKRAVWDDGFCAPDELLAALRADFVGHERLRSRLLALPKYGLGDADADDMMDRVLRSVLAPFDAWRNRHGRYVKPILFTFVWAPEMGRSLGASPDGRRRGQPIGHGLTPQAAGLRRGLTASINSYTQLPNHLVSGGASTMWDLDPQWATLPIMRAVVDAFTAGGGMIFQGNATPVEELRAALDRPADYGHLIVRVGGFSARFVNLSRELQDEIIERHRHG